MDFGSILGKLGGGASSGGSSEGGGMGGLTGILDKFKGEKKEDAKDTILQSLLAKNLTAGLYTPENNSNSTQELTGSMAGTTKSLGSSSKKPIENSNNTADQFSDKKLMQQIAPVDPIAHQVAYNAMANQQTQINATQPSLLMQQAQSNPELTAQLAQRAQNPQLAEQKIQTITSPLGLGSIHIIGKEHGNELPHQAETTVIPDKGFGKIIVVGKRGEQS